MLVKGKYADRILPVQYMDYGLIMLCYLDCNPGANELMCCVMYITDNMLIPR